MAKACILAVVHLAETLVTTLFLALILNKLNHISRTLLHLMEVFLMVIKCFTCNQMLKSDVCMLSSEDSLRVEGKEILERIVHKFVECCLYKTDLHASLTSPSYSLVFTVYGLPR